MKKKIALVRGKFLNKYELQFYEPLISQYQLLGIGSKTCFHDRFSFPVVKLFSPVDLPEFPYKMPILNRLFIDAHYLFALDKYVKGFAIAHSAETYYHYTIQCLNAKKKGLVKAVVVSVFENIPFAGEGIRGRKSFKRRAIEEADHLIAVSGKTKNALIAEGCSEEKITIITQHINTQRFKPLPKKAKKDSLTILFTGRLEIYKGIFDVIKAANLILNDSSLKKNKLRFLIIGEGSQKENILQLEEDLGIKKFFTHQSYSYETMPQVYQKADIYLAPSRTTKHWEEQFSTVLLEAKASGLPIISTSTGGIPENVGKAGILVREGDYPAIAKHLKRLILNPAERYSLGQKARKDALDRFTLQQGAKKVAQVYDKVLASA